MKLLLFALIFLSGYTSYASCIYCTDINEALEKPTEVQHLNLSGHGLTALPDSLHLFSNLRTLNLSDNTIESLDLGKTELPYLTSLNMNFNPGLDLISIEELDKALPALTELHLRDCSIFLISQEIGKMKNLAFLDLSNNKLRTLPGSLENCPLKELRLRNNDLDNAFWMTDLWSLETLDVSDNDKLNLDALGHALLFKSLNKVIVSPRSKNELSKVYGRLDISTLALRGGTSGDVAKAIASSNYINNIVFEGVSIENPSTFYSWFNDFEELESINFVNMELPPGFSSLKTSKTITLDLCSLDRPSDLGNMKPGVKLKAVNMRGASVVGTTGSNAMSAEAPYAVSKAMISNKVPEIAAPDSFKEVVNAQKKQIIVLENTAYDIPKNAFLTESGEVYKGDVNLEIKEFNDPFVNALAGAPMVYRENGVNQVFSSSGMLEFRAYDDNGNELQPNPENIIQVEMVDLQPSEDTRLYAFNEQDSNWVDIGAPTPTGNADLRQKILDSLNTMPDNYFYQVNPVKPDFTIDVDRSRYDPYEFTFNLAREGYIPSKYSELYVSNKDYHKSYEDQCWLTEKRRVFMVDTIMTDKMTEMFKVLQKEGRKRSRYYRKNKEYTQELPIPGTIRELKLTPNFKKDNFNLSFKYKDKEVHIPVIFKDKGSIERVQRKEKMRFTDFDREKERAKKAQLTLDKKMEEAIAEGAQRLREARADYLSDPSVIEREESRKRMELLLEARNMETNRFGLSSFGMVNCDYYSRNPVENYIRSTSVAVDQDGEPVTIPGEIRTVIPEDNVYVYNKSDQLPKLERKKSISFFAIGLTKIAIIIGWKEAVDGFSEPIVRTHSTEGKSPEEMKSLLQKY